MSARQDARLGSLEVLDPVAAIAAKTAPAAPRLRDLSGPKIGLYSNTKPGADGGLDEVARLLGEKFQNLTFEKFGQSHPHGLELLEKIAKSGCEAIISSTAD